MDLSIPGSTNTPLSTPPVFADNVQDLLGTGALQINPSATIVVNSIDDALNSSPSVTTLRDAINKANADPGEDLIVFDRSLFSTAQTITLKLGELDITHSLDIIAPQDTLTGGDLVTVSGNKASRVFEIEKEARVTLSGLIVADGIVTNDDGGGIKNSGTLALDNSIVRNNSASFSGLNFTFGRGGGIYNTGTLKVHNSTISGNSAAGDGRFSSGGGGGIYNSGTSTVYNSTISGNSTTRNGGGIYNSGISTVYNSTISGNSTTFFGGGGGIFNTGTSTVYNSTISRNLAFTGGGGGGGIFNTGTNTVYNSTISRNSAFSGGGIYNISGTLKVNNSTISGNEATFGGGGGILSSGTSTINNSTISSNSGNGLLSSGTSTINNSTISGNEARGDGGGIINGGTLKVNNSTINGNSATQNGGGIINGYSGTLTLLFSTVTQNQAANGGGVYQNEVPPPFAPPRGSNSVRNTIIAANLLTENGVNPDVSGTFTSNGYNLIGDGTGSSGFGEATWDIVGTSDWPIDPRLAPLDFYGGPTQTVALLPGSPAINAGDPTILPTDPTTDQRGRLRVRRGRADIGAFESSLRK